MHPLLFIENHELLCYMIFAALVGTMPPIPDNASYFAKWMYGFLHMFAMNLREGFKIMQSTQNGRGVENDQNKDSKGSV